MTGSVHVADSSLAPLANERLWYWIHHVDDACNRFREDSDVSRLNHAEGRATPVSETFRRTLAAALDAAQRTDGLCTPTILPTLLAWGYDEHYDALRLAGRDHEPTNPPVAAPLDAIEVDNDAGTVRLLGGCQLDLGATAKALTADLVADDVAMSGSVVVEIGGDVAVRGTGPDGPWVVGIATGLEIYGDEPRVAMSGGGIATSSTDVRTWDVAGRTVGHIMDPRTGRPAAGPYRTVTVAADSCVHANAYATATLIRDADADFYLVQAGWSGRLVRRDGTVDYVGGWPHDEGSRS